MNLSHISVTILTKNSQQYLSQVLQPLKEFGEVLIYDTGSTDKTKEIARKFPNVKIVDAPFIGFGPTHNKASETAKHDWILSIDSDEVVTEKMVADISRLSADHKDVYSFPRHNYFNGKFIKWCGWYPDRQIRLYNKKQTQFSNAQVHEAIITENMTLNSLEGPLVHYSYHSIGDFLSKMQMYSSLFAEQNRGKKRSSFWKALGHGYFAFFKSYVLKKGFLGGAEGFIISKYNAHTAYYKYLKLDEINKRETRQL